MKAPNTLPPVKGWQPKRLTPGVYPHPRYWELIQQAANRMAVSQQKYGDVEAVPEIGTDILASLDERLAKYRKTGNTEWLIDVANLALIEAIVPSHPEAHFRATDSDESPGMVGRPDTKGENS